MTEGAGADADDDGGDANDPGGAPPDDRNAVEAVIRSLVDLAATAQRIVDRGEEAYFDESDDILRRAGRSVIIDVSAAVDRLPEEVLQAHSDVPWNAIRATRNVIAHAYDRVNDRFVWEALRTDVGELVRRLTE